MSMADEERQLWAQFGRWVEQRRVESGLTKASLARAAGVSLSTVRTLEVGGVTRGELWFAPSPKDRTLLRLAAALSVPPAVLYAKLERTPPDPDAVDMVLDVRDKIDLLTIQEKGAVEAIIDHILSAR